MKMLCPHCGVKGTADDSYIGKKVRCPKCEGTFDVEPEVQETLESPSEMTGGEEINDSVVAESEESLEEKTLEWSDIAVEIDGAVELDEETVDEEVTDELEINEEDMIDEPAEEDSVVVEEVFEFDVSAVEEVTSSSDEDPVEESTGEKTEVEVEEESSGIAPVLGSDVASTLRAQGFQGNDADLTEPVPDRPGFSLMGAIRRLFGREKN